jgi:hypothetical protein
VCVKVKCVKVVKCVNGVRCVKVCKGRAGCRMC